MTFRASDSSGLLVEQVCGEISVPAANVEKYKASLAENLLDTCGVLLDVSSEDWMAMRIPLRILVEARKRVNRSATRAAPPLSAPSLAPLPESIAEPAAKPAHSRSLSSAGPRKIPPPLQKLKRQEQIGEPISTSFEDLSKFIRKSSPAAPATKDRKRVETSSIKRKLTKGKSGPAPRLPTTGGTRANVIGREGHSNQLVKLALGESAKYSSYVNCSYSEKYTVYGEPVAVEIFDAASVETVDPSILVLVFSTHSLRSLTKMTDKWMLTNDTAGVDIPIILVGLFKTAPNPGTREVSRFTAMEVCEQMKAIRYIEVTSKADAHEVFMECARTVMRDSRVDLAPRYVDVITKIMRAEEKQQQELGLRKRQLPLLPNSILRTRSFLQKLRLDNNNFQFFPEELLEFTHLMELALPYNQIKEIPAAISKMKSLQRLDLEGNQIEALPLTEIKLMNMLEELKLKGNPLSKLPEQINKAGDILAQIKQLEKAQLEDKTELKCELPGYITPFKIFTVPLADLMENEYKLLPDNPIPRIVRRAFAHILTYGVGQEGIFRLAGQNQKMDEMREQIDNLCTVKFAPTENCHNVTNVFKQWLRTLPEPAFQFKNFETVLALADLPVEECLEQCKLILASLPKENYHLIRQTFRLMFLVANNSTVNRMDAGNVTKVVGPNLLYSKEIEMDPLANISQVTNMNDVLQRITENYKDIFEETVPNLFDVDYLQEKIPTAILYRKMFGHKKSVVAVQLTEDKQHLWTGDSAGILRVWDTTTLKLRHEVELGKRINAMVLAAGNMWIGLADSIQIRDQNDVSDLICEIENAPTYNLCVVGDQVWVGDAGKLIIYDVDAFMGEPVDVGALPVCLTAVGDAVWGACADRKIRVWRNDTRALVAELDAQHDGGRINSISTINGMVWSGATNGTIQVWDPEKLEVNRLLELKHEGKVFGVTRVGHQAWTYAWNGDVHVYSVSEPYEYVELLPNFHSDAIGGVAALYSEKFQCWNAMTVSWDTSVCSWLVHAGPAFP